MPTFRLRPAILVGALLSAACSSADQPAPTAPAPVTLTVVATGLPGNAPPTAVVQSSTRADTLGASRFASVDGRWQATIDLPAGAYRVTGLPFETVTDAWTVPGGATPLSVQRAPVTATLAYTRGAIMRAFRWQVVASGAPLNRPLARVSRADGNVVSLPADSVVQLPIGTLRVVADTTTREGVRFVPTVVDTAITHARTADTTTLRIPYLPVATRLVVTTVGLPRGASVSATVRGSDQRVVVRTWRAENVDTVMAPSPGATTLLFDSVVVAPDGHRYHLVSADSLVQVRSDVTTRAVATYRLVTGALAIVVTGLTDTPAAVQVVREHQGVAVSGTQTLTGLLPGTYEVQASPVIRRAGGDSTLFLPASSIQTIRVDTGVVAIGATVLYRAQPFTGRGYLSVRVAGELSGRVPITLTSITGGAHLFQQVRPPRDLHPSEYTVDAPTTRVLGRTWVSTDSGRRITVRAGGLDSLVITYTPRDAAVVPRVVGLPDDIAQSVWFTVQWDGGRFRSNRRSADTAAYVPVGEVQLLAPVLERLGKQYAPDTVDRRVALVAGQVRAVAVVYREVPNPVLGDLAIRRVTLTQAVQRATGSVALVAGRTALLRVFADAAFTQVANPPVEVELRQHGVVYSRYVATLNRGLGPTSATTASDGDLSATYNVTVPGEDIRPQMTVRARLLASDPVPANNTWEGTAQNPQPVVHGLPALKLVVVPFRVGAFQGQIPHGSTDSLITLARALLPIGAWSITVHAPVTSSVLVMPPSTNQLIVTVLNELAALRAAEQADDRTYYYALFPSPPGTMGPRGGAYIRSRIAAGEGTSNVENTSHTFAHELGHNLSLWHAPCLAAEPDPAYPYAVARIGQWGWNALRGTLVSPDQYRDVMSYCAPSWISDYHWGKALDYRVSTEAAFLGAPAQRALPAPVRDVPRLAASAALVQGQWVWRAVAGSANLAVRSLSVDSAGPARTPSTLRLVDPRGRVVASAPVRLDALADVAPESTHAVGVLPVSVAMRSTPLRLELVDASGRVLVSRAIEASVR